MQKAYFSDLPQRVIEAVRTAGSQRQAAEGFKESGAAAEQLQRWLEPISAAPRPRGGAVSPSQRSADESFAPIAEQADLTSVEIVAKLRGPNLSRSPAASALTVQTAMLDANLDEWRLIVGLVHANPIADIAQASAAGMPDAGTTEAQRPVAPEPSNGAADQLALFVQQPDESANPHISDGTIGWDDGLLADLQAPSSSSSTTGTGFESLGLAPVETFPAQDAGNLPIAWASAPAEVHLSTMPGVDATMPGVDAVAGPVEAAISQAPRGDGLVVVAAHTPTATIGQHEAQFHLTQVGGSPSSALLPSATGAWLTSQATASEGVTATQLQQALDENDLSVTGAGVTVGVLSDSFNDLHGAAKDEADGALPPASSIDVIKDLASGGTDEGRAMMQIIHDIAPGADLAFYTAFDSEQDFANGILALAAAGCKVIVDDVSYFDEPFFQNGVVAQAIQTVEAEGVTYVTAAGNDAENAYQASWTPISGSFDGAYLTDAESFAGSIVQTITLSVGSGQSIPLLLEWNQPYGAATSNLRILVFNDGSLIGTVTNQTDGEPTNPWIGLSFSASGTYQIAIENLSGPDPSMIKEIAAGDGLPVTISGANSGTVYGHAMTPGVITAGAVNAADTPAFGDNTPASESFSSSGAGTELLFANNGADLASPDQLSPVALSGLDNIQTTISGDLGDFFGTSAAAASLAGVAALILQANPALSPAEVEQIMESTALPMANSAVSGAGLIQVDPAVGDALAMGVATASQIGQIYEAVLQRAPTNAELATWLAETPSVTGAAIISAITGSSEAMFNVYSVVQIIDLATGALPAAYQLAGWVPFVESHGLIQGQAQTNPLLDQMALAFVASDNFGKVYNNGVDVDPNSAIDAQEMKIIIPAATGIAATQAQINAWVATGLTIDQVFVDFALGDQYTGASQAAVQHYLTTAADLALATQLTGISAEANHLLTT